MKITHERRGPREKGKHQGRRRDRETCEDCSQASNGPSTNQLTDLIIRSQFSLTRRVELRGVDDRGIHGYGPGRLHGFVLHGRDVVVSWGWDVELRHALFLLGG